MPTKTLTCGTLNCAPINCTQTAATAATQIGFVYTYKQSSYVGNQFMINTTLRAIPAMNYTFPAIGVWLCVYEFIGFNMASAGGIAFGLSLNSTLMDSGWHLKQSSTNDVGSYSGTRIVSVSNLTTTLYCLCQVSSTTSSPNVNYYTLQCTRIA